MKPLRKNLNDDENPIWDKERARYPGQVVDVGQTAEPEKQTGTVNEVKKPVSATDGIFFALGTDLGDLDSRAPVERSQTGQSAISGEASESEEGSSRFWAKSRAARGIFASQAERTTRRHRLSNPVILLRLRFMAAAPSRASSG